jgi:ribosome-associated protein
MDDTARNDIVKEVGQLLDDHKGIDTLVLDIRENCSWTDFFIITTTTSQGHLRGLVRQLDEYLSGHGIEIARRTKSIEDEGWTLLDCGFFVVHLMSREFRDFYNLEKLWYTGKLLFEGREKEAPVI